MSDKRMRILIAVAAGLALAAVLWVGVRAVTLAAPAKPLAPQQSDVDAVYPLSFQGRLTSDGQPVVTPVSVTFRIYDGENSTTAIFSETQTIDPDENGLFSTALHVNPPLGVSSLTNVWMGVQVGSDSAEMSPRIQMTGVGYAFTLVPGAGISGTLYMTDTPNAILNAFNMGDGIGLKGFSIEGTGVYAFSRDSYAVEAHGGVLVTGQYTGTFPSPAYNSGWRAIGNNAIITLTHNLGGASADDYVVDLYCQDSTAAGLGINQAFYGGDVQGANVRGVYWRRLTTTSIEVYRAADDIFCGEVRVRIWAYK